MDAEVPRLGISLRGLCVSGGPAEGAPGDSMVGIYERGREAGGIGSAGIGAVPKYR